MMRHPVTIVSTLFVVISTISASGGDQSVWDQCNPTHDTDASIAACAQILQAPGETTSDRATAYYIRGTAHYTEGNPDSAVADYTKAIEANSRYAAGRGIVHQARGDNDSAVVDYKKVIEIDPRYVEAYVGRDMV
jgi:tetratricopeptide (TPR) repeat protein